MKQVIETYAAVWVIMLLFMLALAFTTINMNVIQARKIYNDIVAETQASNGLNVDGTGRLYYSSTAPSDPNMLCTLANDGFQYEYSVIRQSLVDENKTADNETYIYNSLYKVSLKYEYFVPLFGKQVYPITGFAY